MVRQKGINKHKNRNQVMPSIVDNNGNYIFLAIIIGIWLHEFSTYRDVFSEDSYVNVFYNWRVREIYLLLSTRTGYRIEVVTLYDRLFYDKYDKYRYSIVPQYNILDNWNVSIRQVGPRSLLCMMNQTSIIHNYRNEGINYTCCPRLFGCIYFGLGSSCFYT